MVVEYKKGSGSGIVSQAVSSLSWQDSARHEFGALAKEKLGAEAAEAADAIVAADAIDWRNPRMVCIAAGFSHHDRVAPHRLHERIDLVRYRAFDGGLLSLLLIESVPGSPRPAPARPAPARRQRRERMETAGTGGVWVETAGPGEPERTPCLPARPVRRVGRDADGLGRGRGGRAQALHRLPADGEPRLSGLRPKRELILLYLRIAPDTISLEKTGPLIRRAFATCPMRRREPQRGPRGRP
ncbi:hypothetical protein [Streptomyces sp. N50]|uniref:hypothetical protein n=1 Tax=Streptomyces sp. N50 TaxID=3081765 RepID=UPI00296253FC|nr:hypothetical protein [Streptomyces sp. N50]WOX11498.1 hypothetical protein R2B38_22865 [Streptomyces sp. N50]